MENLGSRSVVLPFGGILRMAGWLNGVAALLLIGVSLLGEDILPSDLTFPLLAFLIGVLSCGLSGVFAYWADTKILGGCSSRVRRGHWLLVSLAAMTCLMSFAAFAAGCWVTVGADDDEPAPVNITTVLRQ